MKRFILFIIIIGVCFIQTTVFAIGISDSSKGDRIGIFEDVKIDKSTPGSVVVIMGNADIQNNVNGDVIVIFGNITINSKVSGSVVTVLGKTKLTENSEIGGDFVSVGNTERSDNATIKGYFRTVEIGDFNLNTSKLGIVIILKSLILIVFMVFVILLGFPLLMIFNKRFQNISQEADFRLGKKFSIGFPGFVICFVTLILLGVTGLIALVYFLYALIIEIIVSMFIGKMLLKMFNVVGSIYIQFIIGLIVLVLLKVAFIFLISVNGFPVGVALCFGFDLLVNALGTGILIDSQFGKKVFT